MVCSLISLLTANMNKQRGDIETALMVGFFAFMAICLVGSIIFGIYRATNHHQVEFTVNKTERVVYDGGQDSRYMVYTDKGVFENTDSLLNGKFNSADLYNQLKTGKKYECEAVGFRNGFFSWFENLISCKEV